MLISKGHKMMADDLLMKKGHRWLLWLLCKSCNHRGQRWRKVNQCKLDKSKSITLLFFVNFPIVFLHAICKELLNFTNSAKKFTKRTADDHHLDPNCCKYLLTLCHYSGFSESFLPLFWSLCRQASIQGTWWQVGRQMHVAGEYIANIMVSYGT